MKSFWASINWDTKINQKNAKVNWQFTTEDARIKLSRLYPTLED